jgi:hypothetical protein
MTDQPYGSNQPYGSQPYGSQPYGSQPYGSQPYGSMPSEPAAYNAPPAPTQAPPVVKLAVRLMFVRAALSLISVVVVIALKGTLKDDIRKNNPGWDADKVNTAFNVAIVFAVVFAVVFVILYLLLAMQVGKGKNWARIVTWVIAGLGVAGLLSSLAQTAPPLSHILSIVTGLIDIAIIVLLVRANGTGFFRKRSTY